MDYKGYSGSGLKSGLSAIVW